MALQFQRATKKQSRLRMALCGPSGSGKTYTALKIATGMRGKIAVIDTERGSASKYSDIFEFDVIELSTFAPQNYIDGIHAAEQAAYDTLIIDSLSHAWTGKGGVIDIKDKASKRSQSGNDFMAWREATPQHNNLVEAILQSSCHIIVTMRTKTEYAVEKDEKTGKTTVRKIGLAPVQRDGMEYEFDVVGDLSIQNELMISKTRCSALNGGVFDKPGQEMADILTAWLADGVPMPAPKAPPPLSSTRSYHDGAPLPDNENTTKAYDAFLKEHNGHAPSGPEELRTWWNANGARFS